MGSKKKSRTVPQAAATPTCVAFAEQLAREVCKRLGTTPERAADELNNALSRHRVRRMDAVRFSRPWREPWQVIHAASLQGKINAEIANEQLAAALWLGAQEIRAILRQPNGNTTDIAELSWALGHVATALRFPQLRGALMGEFSTERAIGAQKVKMEKTGIRAAKERAIALYLELKTENFGAPLYPSAKRQSLSELIAEKLKNEGSGRFTPRTVASWIRCDPRYVPHDVGRPRST
jgi:hypothetical protein